MKLLSPYHMETILFRAQLGFQQVALSLLGLSNGDDLLKLSQEFDVLNKVSIMDFSIIYLKQIGLVKHPWLAGI